MQLHELMEKRREKDREMNNRAFMNPQPIKIIRKERKHNLYDAQLSTQEADRKCVRD